MLSHAESQTAAPASLQRFSGGARLSTQRPETPLQARLAQLGQHSPQALQLKVLQELADRRATLQKAGGGGPGAEEEEPLQMRAATLQKVGGGGEEEEPIQGRFDTVQRVGGHTEEEEPAQGRFVAPVQRAGEEEEAPVQSRAASGHTGLPQQLKAGVEALSGLSLDHVRVHYNSSKPAQLQALAYAQGSDIHVGPGQEQHLPHEAWHVVQQAQGRVRPTLQMHTGVPVNDDPGLEREADAMGARALTQPQKTNTSNHVAPSIGTTAHQMKSEVFNTGQDYAWNGNKTIVGKRMEAYIDPDDKLYGESANLNKDQDPMMHWIKSHWTMKASDAVKGHLLNDNLGGKALNVNLFPITKAANAVHLRTAENYVKNAVWNQDQGIYYRVDADIGTGNISTFTYTIQQWNPKNKNKYGTSETGTIYSDLGNPKDMDTANQDDLDLVKAEMSNAEAFKGNAAYHPATAVGHLSHDWQKMRDISGSIRALNYSSDSWKYNS